MNFALKLKSNHTSTLCGSLRGLCVLLYNSLYNTNNQRNLRMIFPTHTFLPPTMTVSSRRRPGPLPWARNRAKASAEIGAQGSGPRLRGDDTVILGGRRCEWVGVASYLFWDSGAKRRSLCGKERFNRMEPQIKSRVPQRNHAINLISVYWLWL